MARVVLPGEQTKIPPRIRGAVIELGRRLELRFGPRLLDLRLFGSYARGDWGPDSDVDVLVVILELSRAEQREVFDLGYDVSMELQVPLAPLALSSEEYALLRSRELRIVREIDRDGVRL